MWSLLRSIVSLLLALLPFLETVFLAYSFGELGRSSALAVVLLLLFMLATVLKLSFPKVIAWGIWGFAVCRLQLAATASMALAAGLALAVIRYLLHAQIKRLRR